MMDLFDIEVSGQESQGVPSFRAKFGRITVILGANGSGKSRLLNFLRQYRIGQFGRDRPLVCVEGGRVVTLPDHIKLDRQTINEYATYNQALNQHRGKRSGKITERINDALLVLERLGEEEKTRHSDAVNSWQHAGNLGPCPTRQEPPLDRLFRLFNQALPVLKLKFDRPNLYALKGTSQYSVSSMSDGEKQALAILADIGMLAADNSVIIVDEPELNLHPNLATQLWSAIEADRPGCIFIYGTHSISFAMRQGVDRALVLSSNGSPLELSVLDLAREEDLRPFLGSVPAILRSNRALVVEGEDSSFDAHFYRWVIGDPATEVVALGDCHQVVAATRRSGLWNRLAATLKIVGAIDRDYRSKEHLDSIVSATCHVLELHEAEAFFAAPKSLWRLQRN